MGLVWDIGMLSRFIGIGLVACAIVLLATPRIIERMRLQNFVAPDMNKPKKPLVAELGGTAIFFGFACATIVAIFWHSFVEPFQINLTLLLAGFSTILLIAFIGIFDDLIGWKKGIRQYQHALFPVFAALPLMAVKAGTTIVSLPVLGPVDLGILYAIVLIPLGVTGAANATNMLAGLNGLEAGLGSILTGTMLILSILTNQIEAAIISAAMLGALIGFLRFNWFPARIFPGDATTLMIGGSVAVVSILGNMEKLGLLLFALFFVELALKAASKFQGESFGTPQADGSLAPPKQKSSLTHVVMGFGKFSEPQVSLILIGVQVIISIGVLVYYYLNSTQFFAFLF